MVAQYNRDSSFFVGLSKILPHFHFEENPFGSIRQIVQINFFEGMAVFEKRFCCGKLYRTKIRDFSVCVSEL